MKFLVHYLLLLRLLESVVSDENEDKADENGTVLNPKIENGELNGTLERPAKVLVNEITEKKERNSSVEKLGNIGMRKDKEKDEDEDKGNNSTNKDGNVEIKVGNAHDDGGSDGSGDSGGSGGYAHDDGSDGSGGYAHDDGSDGSGGSGGYAHDDGSGGSSGSDGYAHDGGDGGGGNGGYAHDDGSDGSGGSGGYAHDDGGDGSGGSDGYAHDDGNDGSGGSGGYAHDDGSDGSGGSGGYAHDDGSGGSSGSDGYAHDGGDGGGGNGGYAHDDGSDGSGGSGGYVHDGGSDGSGGYAHDGGREGSRGSGGYPHSDGGSGGSRVYANEDDGSGGSSGYAHAYDGSSGSRGYAHDDGGSDSSGVSSGYAHEGGGGGGYSDDSSSGSRDEGSGDKGGLRGQVEQLSTYGEDGSGETGDGSGTLVNATARKYEENGNKSGDDSGDNEDVRHAEKASGDAMVTSRDKDGAHGISDKTDYDTSEDTKESGGDGPKDMEDRKTQGVKNLEESDILKGLVSSRISSVDDEMKESDKNNVKPREEESKDKKQNLEGLLLDFAPSGVLPRMPRGFHKLSDMSSVSFAYDVDEDDDITVTSDIDGPLNLFDGKLVMTDSRITFIYKNHEKKGNRWYFEVRGKWITGNQTFQVLLENSKHDDHFTLTGEGDSLSLNDYTSMFIPEVLVKNASIDMKMFRETTLADVQIYIVFKDDENLVSLVSGEAGFTSDGEPSVYNAYIQKFPEKDPVFSVMIDFNKSTPLSALSAVMDDSLSNIPYVAQLLRRKGLLRITDGAFGFVASSSDVGNFRLAVFGGGKLEKQLGSRISAGVTLTLPVLFDSQDKLKKFDTVVKITKKDVRFSPFSDVDKQLKVSDALKTLSEFTRPKFISLGYPDFSKVILEELVYDLEKLTFAVFGYTNDQFTIVPGMVSMDESRLEFRQPVPNEFSTLALYGHGRTTIGASKLNVSVKTDTITREVIIAGAARNLWSADIRSALGVTMETNDDVRRILEENHMMNVNIEDARMFTVTKGGVNGSIHFTGLSKPALWNDPIEVETVVFYDSRANRKRMTTAYVFDKLPLSYAIDAFSFGRFPSPRLLDNSRNTSLVLSPINTDSMFLNPAMYGLSFMTGLSLVGQFRQPDVCSLNTQCETASQLLGTEKWYRVQGLLSLKGSTLAGYVDKDFTLAKGLTLRDNIIEFTLGNYSYMSIATALYLNKNNLTFRGYISFDNNGLRLRMTSNDIWSQPFPGRFVAFDRLQIDVPFASGIPMEEFLITGEMNFGLPGSLYRIFAPAYLTYNSSTPDKVAFQATLSNITLETIISALNFKTTLPEVLRSSRFPETLLVKYEPNTKRPEMELYGKLRMLERTLICKLRIDDVRHIAATTSHSKYPLILDSALVMVYADQNNTKLGPRLTFEVSPSKASLKVVGYATFMGLGTDTAISVSDSGTEFSLFGNLFGLTKTVVSIMSPDSIPERGPYVASACIPEVIPQVVSRVDYLLAAAADQANGYMKQASRNFRQANMYHQEALATEEKYKDLITERESDLETDDREWFLAEERYNKTCKEQHCHRTCIGCTAWHKCCDRDVFGNCVRCPGWKPCCWRGKNPICKAKNHGCRIMKQLAKENLQKIATRVYQDKEKKEANDRTLWESEYLKGKTQAVLEAARRALNLVSDDSKVGLGAAASIKRFGLQRLVNIQSICFQTSLKSLATSCVGMKINATFANEPKARSIPYYGCLNRELVPKMANYIANDMFPRKPSDKTQEKRRGKGEGGLKIGLRSTRGRVRSSIFGDIFPEETNDLLDIAYTEGYDRRKREQDNEEMEQRPFWLMRHRYQPHGSSMLEQRMTVPRSPLRKKWQIPATKKGKCKVYRQLVEICKDMMSTVQRMYRSYKEVKNQFSKRRTELELGLNTTIADLEKQALEFPELKQRLGDIEMNIRTVNAGVRQWKLNCEADQNDQNKKAIQDWVSTMEDRITRLGGQGVARFLSNLFRAFEGIFLGADTPKNNAEEVLNTLQAIREISATFHDMFGNSDITLEKANSRAEIVLAQLKHITKTKIFCDE